MRRFSTTLAIAISTLLFVSICSAQQTATTSVPNLIRYSGTLKDAQGAAPSSSTAVGVTFSIYKQQDGGAAVWMETQNITPDANGQYNVILGSTTATGLPDDLFLQEEQRWLGVQVQGQDEQARVLLVSVPYAFKAHEADTLGGLPPSAFVKAPTGAVGGAYGNGTTVNALGNVGNAGSASKGKDANGHPLAICTPVPGAFIYWDSQGSECPSNLFQVFNPANPYFGNIGVKNNNPSTELDVNGVINAWKWYDITKGELPFLSIGWPGNPPPTNQNTWLGVLAGGQGSNTTDSGVNNTFVGYDAFFHNQAGSGNTAVGVGAGFRNTSGNNNTYVGLDSGWTNSGNINNNTFSGWESGFANSGSNNVFYGYRAGAANTANGNSFFGFSAGTANMSGNSNTFLGNMAGIVNTTGSGDTFVGDSAGAANVTGNNNTFMGQNAGKANTVSGNSFFGFNSGTSNTIGAANTFLGEEAGKTNATGGGNTSVGYQAGLLADGCCSTFVGAGAGVSTTVGGNQFFGYRAGGGTTTGFANVFTGYFTGLNNTTGTYNAFYGVNTGLTNTTGSSNTFLGIGAGSVSNQTGSSNIYVGFNAGNDTGSGNNNNIEIGNLGTNQTGEIQIGDRTVNTHLTYMAGIYHTSVTTDQVVVIGADGHLGTTTGIGGGIGPCSLGANYLTKWTSTTTVDCSHVWENPGNFFIGIGTQNPSAALDVAGDISANPHGTPDRSSYQIGETTVLTAFGDRNTIVGFNGAHAGNNGHQNTFVGESAGLNNTSGSFNTFIGSAAGAQNTPGSNNTCIGQEACRNVTGDQNTMVGVTSGVINVGGSNIFLGYGAGQNNDTGSSNIYLGNDGAAGESNAIRIGTLNTQTDTWIQGIYSSPLGTGSYQDVCVDATGKLFGKPFGFDNCDRLSSRRFKEQIADMGDSSSKLFQLRPVTFFYKPEYDKGTRTPQYGLIAEEVAKIYPDLVVFDKDGRPLTVKYQLLAPMLLNELQKEHTVVMSQQDELQTQLQQIKAQRHEIDGLKLQLQQQNASLQERLTRLESYVATQMKTASDNPPRTTPSANGGLQ